MQINTNFLNRNAKFQLVFGASDISVCSFAKNSAISENTLSKVFQIVA